MVIASLMFSFFRILELVTLIPTLGMLAYFVNGYVAANQLTPNYILVLFIVSVLAAAWALATLVRRDSTRRSAIFVSFIDLCFIGALIASVYELRDIAKANCTNVTGGLDTTGGVTTSGGNTVTISPLSINYTPFQASANKTCSMLKACFAFGIMNCIFFAITSFWALLMHRREKETVVKETTYRRRSHDSRRGHSRSASHRRRSTDSRRQYYV